MKHLIHCKTSIVFALTDCFPVKYFNRKREKIIRIDLIV